MDAGGTFCREKERERESRFSEPKVDADGEQSLVRERAPVAANAGDV